MGNKWDESYDCSSLLLESFQAVSQGGGTEEKSGEFHEQRIIWDSRETKVTRGGRTEYQRGEGCM